MQPLNMDPDMTEQTILHQFKTRLAQKRKALDVEIEKFMAQKDAEFRRFEKELKSLLLMEQANNERSQLVRCEAPSTIVARGFTVEPTTATPDGQSGIDIASSKSNVIQSSSDTIFIADAATRDHALEQTTDKLPQVEHITQRQDQMIGLGGVLFATDPQPFPRMASNSMHPREALSNDQSSWISTSLDTQGKASDTERPSMSARRSSSSPTGTGRSSRKSSMKRPDSSDSTRARKHVLFSIDNQVISPNSSPAAVRSVVPLMQHPPIPFSGLKNLSVDSSSIHLVKDVDLHVDSPPQTLMIKPSSSLSRSYKDLIESTVVTRPGDLLDEDLQSGLDEALFGIDDAAAPPAIDEDEWNLSPVEVNSEDDQDTVSVGSPHSGSLPIQIRQVLRDSESR